MIPAAEDMMSTVESVVSPIASFSPLSSLHSIKLNTLASLVAPHVQLKSAVPPVPAVDRAARVRTTKCISGFPVIVCVAWGSWSWNGRLSRVAFEWRYCPVGSLRRFGIGYRTVQKLNGSTAGDPAESSGIAESALDFCLPALMDEPLTKRILISGLTPTITQDDLSHRLGSFGSVTALDGLGALDALGQPRKFAYATLATTKGKLAKCMNVLSGSTWKGAKLRIGEAKPDFRERIALENTPTDPPPRKRIRLARGVQGTHSADMSLVTPENVHLRPQWRVTALGRLVRPVRMRPMHPLDPPIDLSKSAEKRKGKGQKDKEAVKGKEEKPTQKRKREPPTRARRRTIDPLQWGSQHIVGVFLEGGNAAPGSTSRTDVEKETVDNGDEDSSTMGSSAEESSGEERREAMVEDDPAIPEAHHTAILPLDATSLPVARTALPLPTAPVVVAAAPITSAESTDLAQEAEKAYDLLRSMFGDPDPDGADWGGAESAGSDVDVAELVPELQDAETGSDEPEEADGETKEPTDTAPMSADQIEPTGQPTKSGTQVKKLKDLFAPREEEAGFSLLNHLDLDLDLDDDFDLELSGGVIPPISTVLPSASILPVPSQKALSSPASLLDPARPLFFPRRAAPLGAWRTRFAFHRTDTDEHIRSKWETERGELTREWKRRYREAVKSRRRRGGEDTAAGEAG